MDCYSPLFSRCGYFVAHVGVYVNLGATAGVSKPGANEGVCNLGASDGVYKRLMVYGKREFAVPYDYDQSISVV